MAVEQKVFGKGKSGQDVMLYTLSNSKGVQATVTNFGAILVSLIVPDPNGVAEDIVLGYDDLERYYQNSSYFGATVGPSANRIADAKFVIDGTIYTLDANDGKNNLHSHADKGFHKRIWDVTVEENSVVFTIEETDGNLGFPGNRNMKVTYTLDEENALTITYDAESDKKTVINPTNHTYFNLDGHGSGSIEEHELWLNASYYTPVVAGAIPTGEIAPVANTPMDFTKAKKVGLEIDNEFEQLQLTNGYDHNWVLDDYDGTLKHFATLEGARSGRKMLAYTTLPGVQFYAGNGVTAGKGKANADYNVRSGLCLETQFFPNSVNEDNFASCIFGVDNEYHSVTVYKFV